MELVCVSASLKSLIHTRKPPVCNNTAIEVETVSPIEVEVSNKYSDLARDLSHSCYTVVCWCMFSNLKDIRSAAMNNEYAWRKHLAMPHVPSVSER